MGRNTSGRVGRPKGLPKTGGRKPGVHNKLTVDVKLAAKEYTDDALSTLGQIMLNVESPEAARVAAARELLDRGHGKPGQAMELTGKNGAPLTGIASLSTVEVRAKVLALLARFPA